VISGRQPHNSPDTYELERVAEFVFNPHPSVWGEYCTGLILRTEEVR
jgi:hypothetical protein